MLAHGGPGYVETAGDLARGELRVGHKLQDGTAARLGERAEGLVRLLFSRATWPSQARGPFATHGPPPSCR